MMNSTSRKVLAVLAIPAGIFLFVYGGYDDSPGAQGLGLLLAVFGVWRSLRW